MALTKVTGEFIDISDLDLSDVGTISLDAIQGDADANTSITFSGSDVITIATGGSGRLTIGDGALSPVTDNQIDLGTASLEFKDAFFDGTVTADAFAGPLTGNVTGNASGTALTVTQAAQSAITSLGTLSSLTISESGSGYPLTISSNGDVSYNAAGDLDGESFISIQGTSADGEAAMIRWANHGSMNNYFGVVQVGSSGQGDFVWTSFNGSAYAERMRIDSSGVVSIGQVFNTRHTDFAGSAYSTANDGILTIGSVTGDHQAVLMLGNQNIGDGSEIGSVTFGSQSAKQATITAAYNSGGNGNLRFGTNSGNTFGERMRINAGGDLMVGTTTAPASMYNGVSGSGFGASTAGWATCVRAGLNTALYVSTNGQGAGGFISFSQNGATRGDITYTGSAVAYNTSSDYRLKENVVTDWDATTRLKQLKPSQFNFIETPDTTVEGFLAHEVSSIVPQAITGEKDEVYTDENSGEEKTNGEPKYQVIDQSKLVPLLVKTVQELEARIKTLEDG